MSEGLPRAVFNGEIIIVNHNREIEPALKHFKHDLVLGFDTETKPSFKKGEVYDIALLQLANQSVAVLFQLQLLTEFDFIKKVLEDKNIVKTGVAIRDDIKKLNDRFKFTPQNFVELATLAKEKNFTRFGLAGLCEDILNLSLSKKAKLTNWQHTKLSQDQIQYAACDAYVGLLIYEELQRL